MSIEIKYVAPLSKVEFERIFDAENTTKAYYDRLLKQIDDRFGYVFETYRKIIELPIKASDWFDFDNESNSDGDPVRGYFDPEYYSNDINVSGEFKSHDFFYVYEEGIPTSWLYTDFEDALTAEYKEARKQHFVAKEAANIKAANTKKTKAQLQASIKSKLSKEELAVIKFI